MEDFNGITTNTYEYIVAGPLGVEVDEATENREIVNTPKKGSILVTKKGLEGNDQANLTLNR